MHWRYKWQKLEPGQQGVLNSLEPFAPRMIRVGDERICVVLLDDGVRGMYNICPHAGAALHAGYCSKRGVIACPLHDYKFDLRTGRSADGNNYQLKTYPFEQREDGWYVGLRRF